MENRNDRGSSSLELVAGMMAGLERLIQGTRRVQDGHGYEIRPVTSNDEIGKLTVAFNHMVEDLRAKDRIKETFGKFADPRIVANFTDRYELDLLRLAAELRNSPGTDEALAKEAEAERLRQAELLTTTFLQWVLLSERSLHNPRGPRF